MKLLFDENLAPRLVERLRDVYPDSLHVSDAKLGNADDSAIWEYAKRYGLALVSKDSDSAERGVLESDPPKIIRIRLGNCSSADMEGRLRSARTTMSQGGELAQES